MKESEMIEKNNVMKVRRTECNAHHIMSNRINKQVNADDYNAKL